MPYGDANCLTNQLGWNQLYSFFLYIYGALIIMFMLRRTAREKAPGSVARREGYQQLIFLILLWYSPLVQNAASSSGARKTPTSAGCSSPTSVSPARRGRRSDT